MAPAWFDLWLKAHESLRWLNRANMPSAVARSSALALNNATLPFALALANKGYKQALIDDPHLPNGLNVFEGAIAHEAVAKDLGQVFRKPAWLV